MSTDDVLASLDDELGPDPIVEARRHPLARCEVCPLNNDESTFVPSQIPENAIQLTVVGEAPGWQESIHGRPFAGPSGKLIKTVLQYHKVPLKEVLFTNAVLCRPPVPEGKGAKANSAPHRQAIAACSDRLVHELGLAASRGGRDVLALGNTAASVLVDDTRTITSLRVGPPKHPGRRISATGIERVVASWHPAYCLRNADAFPSLVSDVAKLTEVTSVPWVEPDIRIFDDPASALAAIDELRVRADELVLDIEVGIDKDESFGHPNEYGLLCVGLAYTDDRAVVFGEGALSDSTVRAEFGSLLASKKIGAHNGKFDLAGLFPVFGDIKLFFDTMLAHYALDERSGGHALEYLSIEELGSPSWKDKIKQYVPKKNDSYANIPRPILYHYNGLDACNTWRLWKKFKRRLDRPVLDWPYPDRPVRSLRDVHDFMVAASNELKFLELNGIKFDYKYNNELTVDYLGRIEKIEVELDEIVNQSTKGEIASLNPRSPQQITKYLASLGVNVDSTDVDTLEPLAERLAPESFLGKFVSTLLRHRREQKLYSTYVTGLRKRAYRGRVYTTYMLHGTTSGRLASRNPNLQNVVRDKAIRKQFTVSKDDHVLIQADYKQAEGRVITTLAQDEYLRSIFADDTRDMFDELSNQLYGLGNWAKEERVRTKAFFYGLSYGREARSIAFEYKMSLRDAELRMSQFMDLIPATARWQRDVKNRVLSGKDLITPFGRRRRFHLITKQNQHSVLNEALSYLPQSTASDICLSALIDVRPRLKGLGWIRLTIHDALVVETPERHRNEVSEMLREAMVRKGLEFTDYVPFTVDLSYGRSWGDL